MNPDKLLLLREEIDDLAKAASFLDTSAVRTNGLIGRTDLTSEELERLEALTSRFARLADLLTQRVMRLIDDLELLGSSSLLDRIQRAEKRGWVDRAEQLVRIRELRNTIAHEYAAERMAEIYAGVVRLTPQLLATALKVRAYAEDLLRQFGAGA